MSLLFEISLLGSLLALFVLALRGIGGKWLPAGLLTFAWLLVGLRLLAPVTPDSPLSLLNLRPAVEAFFTGEAAAPAVQDVPVIEEHDTRWTPLEPPPELTEEPEAAKPGGYPALVKVVGSVWLAGFVGLIGLALFGHWRFQRRLLSEAPEASRSGFPQHHWPTHLHGLVRESADAVGLKRPLPLRFSPEIAGPCLCGIFRPAIVLPVGLAATLSDDELRLIFRHEMTHARRRDHWLQGLLGLAAACHWFNPLAWWARRACRIDCELATDADLARRASTEDRETYARLLLKISHSHFHPHLHSSPLFFALSMAVPGKRTLKKRITMINRPNPSRPLARLGGLLLLGLALLAAGTGAVEPEYLSATRSDFSFPSPKRMQMTSDGKTEIAYHDFKPGQERRKLYQTELVFAEIEDLDALLKELPRSEMNTWDSMESVLKALKALDAKILAAPRLVTEEGKQATIRVGQEFLADNGAGTDAKDFRRVTGVHAELVILPDTSGGEKRFGGNPTIQLKGRTVVGENILVDAEGQLLDKPTGENTVAIPQDLPHPLGKISIFGGIHSLKNNQRTRNKQIVGFIKVSEWEPEEATGVEHKKVSQANPYLHHELRENQGPIIAARSVKLLGQAFQVRLFEHPVQEHTAAPRTIASRVFRYQSPREFEVTWKIEEGRLILETDASAGAVYEFPDGFVLDQMQRDASTYQIGHFKRDGRDWHVLLEIQDEAIARAKASGQETGGGRKQNADHADTAEKTEEERISRQRIVHPEPSRERAEPEESSPPADRLARLQARFDDLKIEREELASRYGRKPPKMQENQAELEAVYRQIEVTRPRYVSVLGQVENQGRIALAPGEDSIGLIEAIAAAGGLSRLAADRKVIVRPVDGEAREVDLRAILHGEAPDVTLRPGFTVFVPESVI